MDVFNDGEIITLGAVGGEGACSRGFGVWPHLLRGRRFAEEEPGRPAAIGRELPLGG